MYFYVCNQSFHDYAVFVQFRIREPESRLYVLPKFHHLLWLHSYYRNLFVLSRRMATFVLNTCHRLILHSFQPCWNFIRPVLPNIFTLKSNYIFYLAYFKGKRKSIMSQNVWNSKCRAKISYTTHHILIIILQKKKIECADLDFYPII